MPNLPTIEVTQPQLDRLVAVFPGATNAEKAAAYRAWSVNNLIDLVLRVESKVVEDDLQAARAARIQTIIDSLPPRPPNPIPQ